MTLMNEERGGSEISKSQCLGKQKKKHVYTFHLLHFTCSSFIFLPVPSFTHPTTPKDSPHSVPYPQTFHTHPPHLLSSVDLVS
jgi:hypothetical protein